MNNTDSRFITIEDPKTDFIYYKIPDNWWSRFYEYKWAKSFIDSNNNDIVLDAASGVAHPLKFWLAENCKEVYACDLDKRLLSKDETIEILRCNKEYSGVSAPKLSNDNVFEKLKQAHCSVTKLPYKNKTFDKIFCISVLEHLDDWFNKKETRAKQWFLRPFHNHDIYLSIKEFKRTLKDDGLIIMTFDYPRISLSYLQQIVKDLNLEFIGTPDFNLPANAVYNEDKQLHVFRTVLRKKR